MIGIGTRKFQDAIMNAIRLLTQFTGRMVNWGFTLGTVTAFIGWLILAQLANFSFGLLGVVFGATVGILIGGLCGLVSGVVTLSYFRQRPVPSVYSYILIGINGVIAFLLALAVLSFYSTAEVSPESFLIATLMALEAGYASWHVGRWYRTALHKLETVEDKLGIRAREA